MKQLRHTTLMMKFVFIFLVCITSKVYAQQTDKEKIVKAYYSGFEKHNWHTIAAQLADGFTFTTPINDHILIKEFKDSCWGTNKYIKKVSFVKMMEKGNDLMLLVEIHTTDNKLVRNVDLYTFSGGKIKSIEVFFGAGCKFPGNKE